MTIDVLAKLKEEAELTGSTPSWPSINLTYEKIVVGFFLTGPRLENEFEHKSQNRKSRIRKYALK